jgi:hypothetical protein
MLTIPGLMLAACGSSTGVVEIGEDNNPGFDDSVGDEADDPLDDIDWTGATLQVLSPSAGEVLPYGETTVFAAEVLDLEGNPTPFEALEWVSSVGDWSAQGPELEVDDLDAGQHTIWVEAVLPDGTRLNSSLGGIRVQHPDAGTYVGNLVVDIAGEFNELPITASCVGAAVLEIDAYGETATGESTCVVGLLGFSTEAIHVFDFEVFGDEVGGMVSLDLTFFQIEFDVTGLLGDELISADWEADYAGLVDVTGTMELERVSTEVDFNE